MIEPKFDTRSGRWYLRYHLTPTTRKKVTLDKHDGWKKSAARPKTIPPQVWFQAQQFQALDEAGRRGDAVQGVSDRTVREFLDAYQLSYAKTRKENSRLVLGVASRRFAEYCEAHKISKVGDVRPATCREYIESLSGKLAYNTINAEKGLLGGAWSRAVREESIDRNPWQLVETPGEDEGGGTPSWTNTEVARLVAALDGTILDLFLVGINSGFRCQAIRHMAWGWIDWSPKNRRRGTVTIPKEWSKNGKKYAIPLFPELHDVLARRLAGATDTGPGDLVFPGGCRDGGINASNFHKKMKLAAAAAGVEWKGHAWHAMRATFATRYLEMGASPRAVQSWMSHSSLQMTDKYLAWSGEADDDEVDRLESRVRRTPEGPADPADGPTAGP